MTYLHIPGVHAIADFATEGDVLFRYRLEITTTDAPPSPRTACVVMQNPSYASESIADKSVQFMEKIVFQQNLPEFDGVQRLVVVNQFARVQTNGFRGLPEDVGSRNDEALQGAFAESDIIVIGWGSTNPYKERQAFALGLLSELPGKRIFKTRSHPSRGRYANFICSIK